VQDIDRRTRCPFLPDTEMTDEIGRGDVLFRADDCGKLPGHGCKTAFFGQTGQEDLPILA
jgi:hypothetical protein